MKIGCLNKLTNKTEYTYVYHRIKNIPIYSEEPFIQYEIEDGYVPEQYIFDGQQVILDANYIPPAPDYTLIGKIKVPYDVVEKLRETAAAIKNVK